MEHSQHTPTKFRLGSITKQFTAASILLLEERGKLTLDDPVRDKPLDFVPGEKMSCSNSGYLLLGSVIEQVTGGSYEKFVTDNIFTPLGMKDSVEGGRG